MDARARTEISDWIVHAALAGTSENEVAAGVCERLTRAGVALVRLSVATNMLDPIHDARLVRWVRGQGAVDELVVRTEESQPSDAWTKSPQQIPVELTAPAMSA